MTDVQFGSVEAVATAASYADATGPVMDYDGGNYAQITAKTTGSGSLGLKFRAIVAGVLTTLLTFTAGTANAVFAGNVSAQAVTATSLTTSGASGIVGLAGGADITGNSIFHNNLTIGAGLTVSAGGITVSAGDSSFAGALSANTFNTGRANVSAPTSGTPVTLFNIPAIGLFQVLAYINGAGAANYAATALVLCDGTTARIINTSDGAAMHITLTPGLSVQATQSSGGAVTISYSYHRIY